MMVSADAGVRVAASQTRRLAAVAPRLAFAEGWVAVRRVRRHRKRNLALARLKMIVVTDAHVRSQWHWHTPTRILMPKSVGPMQVIHGTQIARVLNLLSRLNTSVSTFDASAALPIRADI